MSQTIRSHVTNHPVTCHKPSGSHVTNHPVTCHKPSGSHVTNHTGHMSQTIRVTCHKPIASHREPIASHRIPSHPNIHSYILSFQLLCNSFIPFFHSYNRGTTFPEPLLIRSHATHSFIFFILTTYQMREIHQNNHHIHSS